MYNHTRHLALERLEDEAAERGANAVVDIITRIIPFGPGVREMLMVGTALAPPAVRAARARPVTSELTGEELWNLTQMGYAPLRLLLGTSVYALGFAGGIAAFFQSFARGEVDEVTAADLRGPRELPGAHPRRGRGDRGRRASSASSSSSTRSAAGWSR